MQISKLTSSVVQLLSETIEASSKFLPQHSQTMVDKKIDFEIIDTFGTFNRQLNHYSQNIPSSHSQECITF